MKKLGQHFLKNQSVVEKIMQAIHVSPGETIVEIGPGHGELTTSLIAAGEKVGAKIIAIEKDKKLADDLSAKNIQVINDDALKILTALPVAANKVVGNIPYYITGHLLRVISELKIKPELCVFMIQKEVAERICAEPPKMNRLAASVQVWAEPKIIASVPRSDFSPQPEVDSAVIQLKNRNSGGENGDTDNYYAAIRVLFAQPRKTILNNLAAEKNKGEVADLLKSIGINPELRPQNLTLGNIKAIADAFFPACA